MAKGDDLFLNVQYLTWNEGTSVVMIDTIITMDTGHITLR